MSGQHGQHPLAAEVAPPAPRQPGRHIVRLGGQVAQALRILAHAAQDRVDETGEALRARVVGKAHGEVDGRAVGHVEMQDLRRAHMQDVVEVTGLSWQRPVEEARQRPRDGTTMA